MTNGPYPAIYRLIPTYPAIYHHIPPYTMLWYMAVYGQKSFIYRLIPPYTDLNYCTGFLGEIRSFSSITVYTSIYWYILVYTSMNQFKPCLSHFSKFPLGIPYSSLSRYMVVSIGIWSFFVHIPPYTIA